MLTIINNSLAWDDENQLKCEKVRFFSEMSEIGSKLDIFNLYEWTHFKNIDYPLKYFYLCFKFWSLMSIFINLNMVSAIFERKKFYKHSDINVKILFRKLCSSTSLNCFWIELDQLGLVSIPWRSAAFMNANLC